MQQRALSLFLLVILGSAPAPVAGVQIEAWVVGEWSGPFVDINLTMHIFNVAFVYDRSCYGTLHRGGTKLPAGSLDRFSCNWRRSPDDLIVVDVRWDDPLFPQQPFRYAFKRNGEGLDELRGRIRLNRVEKR
jgi:hypothetical protein